MITLENAQFIQELISYLIAYFPTVALSGYFESLVAKQFGDNTPERAGFLTLNPLVHMDPIGIAFVALPPHFGFGKRIPLNVSNIDKKNHNLKIVVLFMTRAITHLFITISLLFLFSIIGKHAIPYLAGDNLHPTISSLMFIFKSLLNLNILLTVIYAVVGLVSICLHYLLPDIENQTGFMQIAIFLFPFLMLVVLAPYVEMLLRIFLVEFLGFL